MGTITIDPKFHADLSVGPLILDFPFNRSGSHSLDMASFSSGFLAFWFGAGTGTFTGTIFSFDVPIGTPSGLYAYHLFPDLAELFARVVDADGNESVARANFSILVPGVPDRGSTVSCSVSLCSAWLRCGASWVANTNFVKS